MLNRFVSNFVDGHVIIVAYTLLLQILGAVMSFGLQLLIANNVEVETYGRFNIIFNYVNIASFFVLFGVNTHVLRNISTINLTDKKKLSKIYYDSCAFIIINWLIVTFMICLTCLIFQKKVPFINAANLAVLNLLVFVVSAALLLQYIDRGLGHAIRSMAPGMILKTMLLLAIVLLYVQSGTEIGLMHLFVFYLVAICAVVVFYLLVQRGRVQFGKMTSFTFYKNLISQSKDYFVNRISQTLLKSLDLILIGMFLTSYSAGLYAAAVKINVIIVFGLSAINIVYSSDIARLYKEGSIAFLNRLLLKANFSIFAFGFSILLIVSLFGEHILGCFGAEYSGVSNVLIILSLCATIESMFGVTGVILNMTGHQKFFNKVLFGLIIIYVGLGPIVLGRFGLLGFAMLVLSITIVKNLLQWHFIYFKLGIKTGIVSNIVDTLKA